MHNSLWALRAFAEANPMQFAVSLAHMDKSATALNMYDTVRGNEIA